MVEHHITCPVCNATHSVKLTATPLRGESSFSFACPDLDRRYRLTNFFVDSERGFFQPGASADAQFGESQKAALRQELGAARFEDKFERWLKIDYPPIGLIDEYPEKISEIINTYCMGYLYPAVTSSCCLAERILNRLVLRCRDHFKTHPKYKTVSRKSSFNDWERMLDVISDWELVPAKAVALFQELMPIRHQAIHYNEGYQFETVAPAAINRLVAAIAETFGVINRRDIYLVFDVPGEVWVRSHAEQLPFVKEFVLPHCYRAHAVHEIDVSKQILIERLGKVGPLSDEEFVSLRKESMDKPTR